MSLTERAVTHITGTAKIPSFSTFEERLHPYIRSVFEPLPEVGEIEVPGNNLLFRLGDIDETPPVALTAHLDKINHFGEDHPETLPVTIGEEYIEGAMDDSAGLGILLAIAEAAGQQPFPGLLFFFSEMEESKGLKEHPHLLRDGGIGYENGMGAKQIAETCIEKGLIPEVVITVDTTPLFKGDPGIAVYSRHWEYTGEEPTSELKEATENVVSDLLSLDTRIRHNNNTNDYLHYGDCFNRENHSPVVSVALEPAIYPYHQKGERVFMKDIEGVLDILTKYLNRWIS